MLMAKIFSVTVLGSFNFKSIKMTIQLYWSDFYKQMKKMKMEDDYDSFEKVLIEMFKTKFNLKSVHIEWMD